MDVSLTHKPTLLVLTSTFPRWPNDTEPAFVFELCKGLVERYRVIVLAPGARNARTLDVMDGIQVVRFQYFFKIGQRLAYAGGILGNLKSKPLNYFLVPFFIFFQLIALVSLLRREKVDLIHAHWIIPQGLVVWLAGQFSRHPVPVLCTSHGGDLFGLKGGIFSVLKKTILSGCQAVTVVSETMKDTLVTMGIAEKKIKIISMGVDLSSAFTPVPGQARLEKEIVFVGRLVEKKGLVDLIHAFRIIKNEMSDASLTIIGGGPQRALLEEHAAKLQLADSIRFIGPVTRLELPEFYRKSAVAVFPFVVASDGDQEGLGLVIIEALGCECPVIASGLAAVKDVIVHEQNGLLTRPGDRKSIANAVLRILSEPEWAQTLALRGRKDVLKRYSQEIITTQYIELIDSLLS